MMNPRRLATVPAPSLRSIILASGVVGLLTAFGPAGIQNTGAEPRKDVSAPSLSTEQELAVAPQPSSMLNDDLGQTDGATTELSLAGAVADASIALNKPEPVVEAASTSLPEVPPTEPAPVKAAMANSSDLEHGDAPRPRTPQKSSTSAWSGTSASIGICGRFINGRPRRTASRSLNGGTSPSSGRAGW